MFDSPGHSFKLSYHSYLNAASVYITMLNILIYN